MEHKLISCENDQVKKEVLQNYLNSLAKIGEQLSNERERQLNNLHQQFEKKLIIIDNKQKALTDKFKWKFKTFWLRQEALRKYQDIWNQSNQESSSNLYKEMRWVFVDESILTSKGWVNIEDINLDEIQTSVRNPETLADLFAENRGR